MTGILTVIGWLLGLLPAFVRRGAGSALGALLASLGLRRNVVDDNLSRFVTGNGPWVLKERERIARESYGHFGHLVMEILLLFGPMRRFVRRKVELKGLEHWRSAHALGRGVIFLSSHVGNWEVMAATGGCAGIDLMIVTKRLKPEWLHRAIERGRARCGVTATYEPKTLKDVMGWVGDGRTVGFVLDQYAGPPIGVRVPFMGVPVGTASIVAALARRTGAVVLPVVNYRVEGGRSVVEIHAPLEWVQHEDLQQAIAHNTAAYVSVLERHVREHPEQWLWIHRRFKGDLSPLRDGEWSEARQRQ